MAMSQEIRCDVQLEQRGVELVLFSNGPEQSLADGKAEKTYCTLAVLPRHPKLDGDLFLNFFRTAPESSFFKLPGQGIHTLAGDKRRNANRSDSRGQDNLLFDPPWYHLTLVELRRGVLLKVNNKSRQTTIRLWRHDGCWECRDTYEMRDLIDPSGKLWQSKSASESRKAQSRRHR
jgi:hypothetical protein